MSSDEPPEDRPSVCPEDIWSDIDDVARERTLRLLVELALRIFSERQMEANEKVDDSTDDPANPP